MSQVICPVCGSERCERRFPVYEGVCVTSDMMVLPHATLDNRLCTGCGLIFNAAGTREFSERFYRDAYNLMMRNPGAAIQSFAGKKPVSQALRTLEILQEFLDLPDSGILLEAGAGKGEFLGYFRERFPAWTLQAFEPSGAFDALTAEVDGLTAWRCEYTDVPDEAARCDLVVALGVLEHVKDPLDMMKWARGLLAEGGHFYLRVPNFASNPNDLFCADHLSKLTVASLEGMARAAGFEPVAVREAGVPVFMLLRAVAATETLASAEAANRTILDTNEAIARASIEAVQQAREAAQRSDGRFGIFGMGSSGLFAPFLSGFETSEIAAYIDENQSLWGSEVHGRPVGGLDLLEDRGITDVALAISPVYFDQVRRKLEDRSVSVHLAQVEG